MGWNLRLEAGGGGPLERPQRRLFSVGGDVALHLALEPVSWFEVQAIGGFLGLALPSTARRR